MHPPLRRTRVLGAMVAVTLGAAILIVGPSARPARACSCIGMTDEQAFAAADAVFRGQVAGYESPPAQPVMSSADPAVWTFAVAEVYKGDVAPTQAVVSAVSGATCGLEIPHQGEFFVFADRRDGTGGYSANLCGGTRSTTAGPLEVAAMQPPPTTQAPARPTTVVPRPPPTTVAVTAAPTVPTTTVTTVTPTTVEPGSLSGDLDPASAASEASNGWLVGLAIAGVGLLLGLAVVGIVRRRA